MLTVRPECPDCPARVGESHERGCDVARCLWNGWQRLGCEAFDHFADCVGGRPVVADVEPGHDCGNEVWSGWWPGQLEAAALGLFCFWDTGWQPCAADHPGAVANTTRLLLECDWDRERGQWLRRVNVQ